MKSIRKKVVLGCLAGALAATGLTGCSNKLDGTSVVATVNGEEIPLGVVSFMTRYQQAQTQAMYDLYFGGANADMWDQVMDQETGETYGESARGDVLEQVETMYLLREKAKDYDVTLTKKEQEKITEAAEAFIKANTEETLQSLGVSQSDIETVLEIQTYEKKMYDPIVADVDTKVSDEEAQQTSVTYVKVDIEEPEEEDEDKKEENAAESKEKAQQILDEVLATADADMDAIAKDVDEALSADEQNFTTNPVEEDEDEDGEDEDSDIIGEDSIVPQSVRDMVKDLADGEVASELVEEDDAYYVVRLEKAFDEDATEDKKESIVSQRKDDAYNDILESWKDEAKIQSDEKVLKTLKVTSNLKFTFKQEEKTESENETEDLEEVSANEEEESEETEETEEESETDGSKEESEFPSENAAEEDEAPEQE